MSTRDVVLLSTSLVLLVGYFASLVILTVHWQPVMATVLILVGILSWVMLTYWLLDRLIHRADS